jgi:hypothetical protein
MFKTIARPDHSERNASRASRWELGLQQACVTSKRIAGSLGNEMTGDEADDEKAGAN